MEFKVGDLVTITERPSQWSSKLSELSPCILPLSSFPFTATIEAYDEVEDCARIGGYGFWLTKLRKANTIHKTEFQEGEYYYISFTSSLTGEARKFIFLCEKYEDEIGDHIISNGKLYDVVVGGKCKYGNRMALSIEGRLCRLATLEERNILDIAFDIDYLVEMPEVFCNSKLNKFLNG